MVPRSGDRDAMEEITFSPAARFGYPRRGRGDENESAPRLPAWWTAEYPGQPGIPPAGSAASKVRSRSRAQKPFQGTQLMPGAPPATGAQPQYGQPPPGYGQPPAAAVRAARPRLRRSRPPGYGAACPSSRSTASLRTAVRRSRPQQQQPYGAPPQPAGLRPARAAAAGSSAPCGSQAAVRRAAVRPATMQQALRRVPRAAMGLQRRARASRACRNALMTFLMPIVLVGVGGVDRQHAS